MNPKLIDQSDAPIRWRRSSSARKLIRRAIVLACLPAIEAAAASTPAPDVIDQPNPSGPVPGVVISASSNPDEIYLGSPSIAILPGGDYIASHDWFGPGTGNDSSEILASSDRGTSWNPICNLEGQWWSGLFVHRGDLYLLGTSRLYGDVVIRRSSDGGRNWTNPADEKTGLLLSGRYHCAPVPVTAHEGRLWRGFEKVEGDGEWPRHFHAFALSVADEADLLDAAAWRSTNALPFNPAWLNARRPGWLEGNLVVTPEGRLVDILRLHAEAGWNDRFELEGGAAGIPRYEVAAVVEVAADGAKASFDPGRGFIHFPGSQSKFTIRFDLVSRRYWSLVQKISNSHSGYSAETYPGLQRNVLMLTSSADLVEWREDYVVLRYREGRVSTDESPVGFQYVDWVFDGEDIAAVCRTAWGGHNYHDANFLTFHRLENFRRLRIEDSPPDLNNLR